MATITEDYVSFETAKLLKEKGFDKDFDADIVKWYNIDKGEENLCSLVDFRVYKCPSLAMMMKWLREVHHIHIRLCHTINESYKYEIYPRKGKYTGCCFWDKSYYETYEQACEAACIYVLKNLI